MIRSAATHLWEANNTTTRVCTVPTGMVAVNVEGNTFSSGHNGAFVVPLGSECKIQNLWAEDATIHVVSVDEHNPNNGD